jgi:hypothetical protein
VEDARHLWKKRAANNLVHHRYLEICFTFYAAKGLRAYLHEASSGTDLYCLFLLAVGACNRYEGVKFICHGFIVPRSATLAVGAFMFQGLQASS